VTALPVVPVEPRQDLAFVEAEESLLIRADLIHVDVVVAGVDAFLNGCDVALGVGPADDDLSDVILAEHLDGLLEVGRIRELLPKLPLEPNVGTDLVG